jgi:hypothetical protein
MKPTYTAQDNKLEKLLDNYLLDSTGFLENTEDFADKIKGTIEDCVQRHVKRLTLYTRLMKLKASEDKFELSAKLRMAIQAENYQFMFLLVQHRFTEVIDIMNDGFEYLEQLPNEIFNQTPNENELAD